MYIYIYRVTYLFIYMFKDHELTIKLLRIKGLGNCKASSTVEHFPDIRHLDLPAYSKRSEPDSFCREDMQTINTQRTVNPKP